MARACGKVLVAVFLAALAAAPARAEAVTVLALGDSLTQGYGLPQDQGFVPQLETWLRHRGHDVEIVNGGVSGDTTAGGAARVDWLLTEEVDAMIVALGANDMLRGMDPAVSKRNLAAILEAAGEKGVEVLLVGMKAPGNFGAAYKEAFDGMYSVLAARHDTLYVDNFFKGLGTDDPAAALEFFQPDGIHPNAEGVARIVAALGPAVVDLIRQVE